MTLYKKYEVGHSGIRSGIRFSTLKDARKCATMLFDEGKPLVVIRKLAGVSRDNRYGFEVPQYEYFEKPVTSNGNKAGFKRYAKTGKRRKMVK